MDRFTEILELLNGVIWHDYVLLIVLGVGVLFTVWSGFGQYRALTHGVAVVRVMPNTPALALAGVTGLYAPPSLSVGDRAIASRILGVEQWLLPGA